MKVSYYDYIKKTNVSVLVAEAIFSHLNSTSKLVQLKDVADTTSGGTPLRSNPNYYNGNIPWLKSGELNDGLIESAEEYISEEGLKNSSAKVHPKGTLLVAMYGATAGKTGILNIESSTNQAVCAVFPKEQLERDYLFWFLRSHRFQFIEKSKGGAQPNISQTVILNTILPIISKSKQLQIIGLLNQIENENSIKNISIPNEFSEKVISVFNSKNKVEALSTELSNQLSLVKQLRQQLLQDAVQGKLVAQDPGDEPAGELLKRIKAEKQKLIKEGKLKKEKELPAIKAEEIPFEVPEGWKWCRLGEIFIDTFYGPRFSNSDYVKDGIPTIRTTDMTDMGIIELKDAPMIKVESESKIQVYKLLYNDLLITRTGSIGTMALFKSDYLAIPSAYLIRCRFIFCEMADFIFRILKTDYSLNYFGLNTKTGTRPNINAVSISNLIIPLPPLSEQSRIVQKLEELMGMCDGLEGSIRESRKQNERLLQQVLREALRGEKKEEKEILTTN